MDKKICVLVVKDDKVLIIKNNNEWMFPTFENDGDDDFEKVNNKIVLYFNNSIKNDAISIRNNFNEKNIGGMFYSLKIQLKDFKLNNNQECKWISLDDLDFIKLNDESSVLIEGLRKYLKIEYFYIKIDSNEFSCDNHENEFAEEFGNAFVEILNEDDGDIVWSGNCSLLTAERKFYKVVKNQRYKYRGKKNAKWRTVRLHSEYKENIKVCKK